VLGAAFLHAGISCDCSAVACIACLRAYFKIILAGTQIRLEQYEQDGVTTRSAVEMFAY
jgi:hypothetical protein